MAVIHDSTTPPLEHTYDATDSRVWTNVICRRAVTQRTGYVIVPGPDGWEVPATDPTLTASGEKFRVGFPDQDYASGEVARVQIGGIARDVTPPKTIVATTATNQALGFTSNALAAKQANDRSAFGLDLDAPQAATVLTRNLMLYPRLVATS